MTTIKFLKKDEVLAGAIRGLAAAIAGYGIVGGMDNSTLYEKGVYQFPFDWPQEERFKSSVAKYFNAETLGVLEIVGDSKFPDF